MESLSNSEYFLPQQKNNISTNTDTNYLPVDVNNFQNSQKADEMREEDTSTLPVYSITVKTPNLRRPKSTTFSDWRGQISRPRSSGRKSGLRIDFSPVKRPKSTPYFDIKQENKNQARSGDVKVV